MIFPLKPPFSAGVSQPRFTTGGYPKISKTHSSVRENLRDTPMFAAKNHGFPVDFPLHQYIDCHIWQLNDIQSIILSWLAL